MHFFENEWVLLGSRDPQLLNIIFWKINWFCWDTETLAFLWTIHGQSMDIQDFWLTCWVIFGRQFWKNSIFVGDWRGFPGQLWGTLGSIKDHSKPEFGRTFEVFLTFFGSIPNPSGSTLGPSWTTFGQLSRSSNRFFDPLGTKRNVIFCCFFVRF